MKKIVKKGMLSLLVILSNVIFVAAVINTRGNHNELKITMLDVGQGDGIHIRTPSGMQILIDGGSSDVSEVGKYRIEPYLESQGVTELDYVFISHGDLDHTSGIQEMLLNQKFGIRIHTLILPSENVLDESLLEVGRFAEQYGTRVAAIGAGEKIIDGEMVITCIAPSESYEGAIGNASSMVLDLRYKGFDMLFTGDLENEGEDAVVKSGVLRDYDILKVGHHGSKNSTSEEFLEQVRPEVALISAGKENRYGHPSKETLERLKNIGCEVYSTQECGAIIINTDGEKLWTETWIEE
ncbi:MAG: ComEC/Rec2 family competence protein [Schaedlerella sp.]|nr:ComEC/Rec2 family competence protein [Schaedlerella sp.]